MAERARPPLLLVELTDAYGVRVQAALPARLIGPWLAAMAEDGWLVVTFPPKAGRPSVEVRLL